LKVSATLKGTKDTLGRRTVYIRINDGHKRKFFVTPIKVKPSDFSKGKVKGNPALSDKIKTLILKHEGHSEHSAPVRLSSYLTKCLNEWDFKKYATLKQIDTEVKKFIDFSGDPLLSRVTTDMLSSFRQSLKVSNNTAWKSFKVLKTVFRKAHKERLITHNPFDFFSSPKYKDPPKTYLSKQQVELIEKVKLPVEFEIARTWFIIGCYTGLRFGDMRTFNKKKIKDGRLIIYTAKTGELVSMPMNDKLRSLPYTNQTYNKMLKGIGAIAGIEEPLTAHLSRHTCAVMLADAGVSIEVTGKILGHQSIRSTSVYYKITNQRIDQEFAKLF
jgi:site-specific recombinase XerD